MLEPQKQFVFISDEDWAYTCAVANRSQDAIQRNLAEIIGALVGRALPRFPGPATAPSTPPKPSA